MLMQCHFLAKQFFQVINPWIKGISSPGGCNICFLFCRLTDCLTRLIRYSLPWLYRWLGTRWLLLLLLLPVSLLWVSLHHLYSLPHLHLICIHLLSAHLSPLFNTSRWTSSVMWSTLRGILKLYQNLYWPVPSVFVDVLGLSPPPSGLGIGLLVRVIRAFRFSMTF